MSDPKEEWRDVVGWEERYRVSSHGRVMGLYKGEKVLSPSINPDGYASVGLCNSKAGKKYKRIKVASLVAEAFIGPRPPGSVVCHNDGSRGNDKLSNLRYATQKENIRDKERHGTLKTENNRGQNHGNAKLSIGDVEWMFSADKHGVPRYEIAAKLQVAAGQVSCILNGSRWVETLKDFPWYQPKYSDSPKSQRRRKENNL